MSNEMKVASALVIKVAVIYFSYRIIRDHL